MKQQTSLNESSGIIHIGIAEALAEIHRQAEDRFRDAMKPSRLRPLNYSRRNGMAASDAVIAEILAIS
jgi:hypothetical protein